MTQGFRVVLTGAVLAGHDAKDVRERIAQAFRLSPPQLDTVFSGRRVSVKRDASQAEAQQLLDRILALGLSAEVEAMPGAAPALAPVAAPAVAPAPALPTIAAASSGDELFSLAAPTPTPKPAASLSYPLADGPSGAETITAQEEVTCPQCSDIQPKRTLCRSCGVDMPRLRAAREELLREAREARNTGPRTTMSTLGPKTTFSTKLKTEPAFAGEGDTALLGLGLSGRFNRSSYLASMFLGVALLFVVFGVAGYLGVALAAILAFGVFLYGLRCAGLRFQDMGRSSWWALTLFVPVVSFLAYVMLIFVPGDHDENDYGSVQTGGGAKLVLFSLAMCALAFGFMAKGIASNPSGMAAFEKYLGDTRTAAVEEDDEYTADNVIVMYSMAGCADCATMRTWLGRQGLRYSDYAIDSDPRAADRLNEMLAAYGGDGNWRLPVMEVNGKLLPNSPSPADVRAQLITE